MTGVDQARKNGDCQKAKQNPRSVCTVRRDGREPLGLTHVAAVSYDPDFGRLTVCPESTAWATEARLEQTRVITAANKAAGRAIVRALRILPPGTVPPARPGRRHLDKPGPSRETVGEDPRGRVTGLPTGARRPPRCAPIQRTDPGIAAAVERQTRAMQERSCHAFPDTDIVLDDALAPIE